MAQQKVATVDVVKGKAVFSFNNGKKVEVDPASVPKEIQGQLMMHGLIQKVRDSFAGAKGDGNYAQAQAEGVIEALVAGEWNRRGGGAFGGNMLAEAVARIKGIEIDKAREKLAALTEDQRDSLRKSATVKKEILKIKAERADSVKSNEKDDKALDLI